MNKSEIYKQINKLQSQIQEVEKDEVNETIKKLQSLEWVKDHGFRLTERGLGWAAMGLPTFELKFYFNRDITIPLSFQSCFIFGNQSDHYQQVFLTNKGWDDMREYSLSCYSADVLTEFVKKCKPKIRKDGIGERFRLYAAILETEG